MICPATAAKAGLLRAGKRRAKAGEWVEEREKVANVRGNVIVQANEDRELRAIAREHRVGPAPFVVHERAADGPPWQPDQ